MAFHMLFNSFGLFVVIFFLINGVKPVTTNVALNKTVTSKSVHINPIWADLANIVDGDLRRDGNTCECCAATDKQYNPWIMVDLGKEYWIEHVVVYGRTDDSSFPSQSFSGLQLHFTNDPVVQGGAFHTVEDIGWINFVTVSVGEQLKSRYVTLLLKGTARVLPVCELEVYGSACKSGTYGVNCDQTCGHCYNDEPCDEVTGGCIRCATGYKEALCQTVCSEGTYGRNCTQECGHCSNREPCDTKTGQCQSCNPGFQGLDCKVCSESTYGNNCTKECGHCSNREPCDTNTGECQACSPGFQGLECKQACTQGTFGQDCSSNCGQCYGNPICDTVTGACDNCMAGFKGLTCLSVCDDGTYGSNCHSTCGHCDDEEHCNKIDGTCERCGPGYLGDLCDRECTSGSYGQECSSFCGFCWKYEPCNHTTGLCLSGCAAGRQGDACTQACDNNTFGTNCSLQCHCVDDKSCDSITGECDDSACTEGFFGVDCQQIKGLIGSPEVSDNNNGTVTLAMFIGVVSVLGCIIIVLLVTGVCFLKRRKHDNKPLKGETQHTDEHNYEDLQMQ